MSDQKAPAKPPRFDAKFIEEHGLIEKYLDNKLPAKGARDLENWCRAHPRHLDSLKLAERAETSLRLLEASGRPLDLREPSPPWWHAPYVPIGLALITSASLLTCWAVFARYTLVHSQLEETRTRLTRSSLVQPATTTLLRVSPDRSPGTNRATIVVTASQPQLIELHLDMSYVRAAQFRATVDKQDQGRALILDNLSKNSNGELRVTFNTTALAIGTYTVRIDALPLRGDEVATAVGWLLVEVR